MRLLLFFGVENTLSKVFLPDTFFLSGFSQLLVHHLWELSMSAWVVAISQAWGSVETLLESSMNWLMQGVTDVQDWVSWAQRVGFSQHSLLSRLLGMKYLEGEKLLKLWKSFYPDPDRQRSLWCDKWHLTPREEHPLKKQLVSRANL